MGTHIPTARKTYLLTALGLMTAIVFVGNYIRIPFLGSQIAVSNALCALSGMILGPWYGFAAAGLGSFLYDLIVGYGAEGFITLGSKGAIALVAGLITRASVRRPKLEKKDYGLLILGAALGAVTYVALYMLKTYVMGVTVNGLTSEAAQVKMASKLPASLINAVFTVIASPILMSALHAPLHRIGVIGK